jgi:hypothetical protein
MGISILYAVAVSTIVQLSPCVTAGVHMTHYVREEITYQASNNTYLQTIESRYDAKTPPVSVIAKGDTGKNAACIGNVRTMFRRSLTRVINDLDSLALSNSNRAVEDAIDLLSYIDLNHEPWATVTDEGIAMLQWNVDEAGVILLFGGDGIVTMSTATSVKNYTETLVDYTIDRDKLQAVSWEIKRLYL